MHLLIQPAGIIQYNGNISCKKKRTLYLYISNTGVHFSAMSAWTVSYQLTSAEPFRRFSTRVYTLSLHNLVSEDPPLLNFKTPVSINKMSLYTNLLWFMNKRSAHASWPPTKQPSHWREWLVTAFQTLPAREEKGGRCSKKERELKLRAVFRSDILDPFPRLPRRFSVFLIISAFPGVALNYACSKHTHGFLWALS